jgi:hypothetical protein
MIVNAVNALLGVPLHASLFQMTNTGTGTFKAAEFENVTSGGIDGTTAAIGAIFPEGSNNAITFTANNPGVLYNGLNVVLISDVAKDDERAEYNAGSKTLTIHIEADSSVATAVVAAVEAEVPFTQSSQRITEAAPMPRVT